MECFFLTRGSPRHTISENREGLMGRQLSSEATNEVRALLTTIADPQTPVYAYRQAMSEIGCSLANALQKKFLATERRPLCLVCTAEDADFLMTGVLRGLEQGGIPQHAIRLVCFWNERLNRFDGDDRDSIDIAPVVKQYNEVPKLEGLVLIVVSSIVSTARIVQTNLSTLFDAAGRPARIIVAAPVMMSGVPAQLALQLRPWASSLEHLAFAFDDQRGENRNVVPGIGGSIFARLGIADRLSLVPELIKQRRRQLAT
jgi:hypothetical protein